MTNAKVETSNIAGKFAKAGKAAEEQMAFYLKRAFEDQRNVRVINGTRVENEGDAAQIDHLIIHKYGMIIIESKSVIGRININQRGEWTRHFNGLRGMASPVEQAQRQADFLRKYLNIYLADLKAGGLFSRNFDKMPIDILVAISDTGIIQRPPQGGYDEVMKADQIPGKVKELLEKYRRENGLFGSSIFPFTLNNSEIERIVEVLSEATKALQSVKSYGVSKTRIIDSRMRVITPSASLKNPATKEVRHSTVSGFGHCIRCGVKIPLNPKAPYCVNCYHIWNKFKDKEYKEKMCHICGTPHPTSFSKPSCLDCYRMNKDALDFPSVKSR